MIEAMKQALEALEPLSAFGRVGSRDIEQAKAQAAITSLRQALVAAQAAPAEAEKQEPVAYLCEPDEDGLYGLPTTDKACDKCFPVYRWPLANQTKREWVGLTDAQILELLVGIDADTKRLPPGLQAFARAIEAKLKEKNT